MATDDEKIKSMLRRAVRVGYLRVYPRLERAADEYDAYCRERGRPCVVVCHWSVGIGIMGYAPGLTEADYRRLAAELVEAGFDASVESDPSMLCIGSVHPLNADDLASQTYAAMCGMMKDRRAESIAALYPAVARFTHAESN